MEALYAIGTVLGIAGTLILRDFRDGKNLFKWNAPQGTFAQGAYMREHYNDSLTAVLTEIQVNQKEMMRDNREGFKDISETLIRIEAGGLKLRT